MTHASVGGGHSLSFGGHSVVGGGHFTSYNNHSVVGSRSHDLVQTSASTNQFALEAIPRQGEYMTACDLVEQDASGSYADHDHDQAYCVIC